MKNQKLIGPISQLITLRGLPIKGKLSDDALEIIPKAGIWIEDGVVKEIGPFEDLRRKIDLNRTNRYDLNGGFVALPGFVDCHTHICFAGSRAKDFSMRNSGKSYLEIATAGGGIWDTVKETRKLSISELSRLTINRADQHLQRGVTTIEVKSGYGLDIQQEIKILSAIQKANNRTKADLIPTCLAAHTVPKDWSGTKDEYLGQLITKLFPILINEKLCHRVDAFVEESAFSPDQARPYLMAAKKMGLDITIHADQFSTGGSKLAVALEALSADHLEASGAAEIKLLAESNTIAVALPGASLGLGCDFTPARKILDAGGALAIASDWNPGSAPMGDLLTEASILATFEKLSTPEVLAGLTFRAAAALGLTDRGRLEVGMKADFSLFPTSDYREILYHQGQMKPTQVWKSGKKIHHT